jgi:transcriptional regulator with XRE-family HTH domain
MKPETDVKISDDVLGHIAELGNHVRVARTRRRLTSKDTADRIGVSVPTLRRLERGDPTVSLGTFASALWLLGLLDRVGEAISPASDTLGTAMELARMPRSVRKPVEKSLDDK